jgi:hypothetical protein
MKKLTSNEIVLLGKGNVLVRMDKRYKLIMFWLKIMPTTHFGDPFGIAEY